MGLSWSLVKSLTPASQNPCTPDRACAVGYQKVSVLPKPDYDCWLAADAGRSWLQHTDCLAWLCTVDRSQWVATSIWAGVQAKGQVMQICRLAQQRRFTMVSVKSIYSL